MNKMIESFARFFAKGSTMRTSFIFAVILFGANVVLKLFIPLISLCICDIVFLLCLIFLQVSFNNHNKNVQKGLIGAVLMWYLYDQVNYVVGNIIFNADMLKQYDTPSGKTYLVLSVICAILFAGLFINHFIINSDHHSRPVNVFINQILIVLIAIISVVSIPFQLSVIAGQGLSIAEAVTWHTGLAALVILIGSYEALLDAYRINREAAGWTQEKGYPEGYTHEHEKQ